MMEPKEHPVLFTAPMVRAILDNSKSQTRRIPTTRNSISSGGSILWGQLRFDEAWVDTGPSPAGNAGPYLKVPGDEETVHRVYPRWQVGDHLWVRETWAPVKWVPGEPIPDRPRRPIENHCPSELWHKYGYGDDVIYRADGDLEWSDGDGFTEYNQDGSPKSYWRPSIFIPRWASRITLEVIDLRVERVSDISDRDCLSEGLGLGIRANDCGPPGFPRKQVFYQFRHLWNSINQSRGYGFDTSPWVWVYGFKQVEVAGQ